jgi:acetyltransferase-like isoleucine patch superfamily enzyme
MSFVKASIRPVAEAVGLLLTAPLVGLYRARILRYATVSNALSLTPGSLGTLLRRAWYRWTLESCGRNLVVDFGAAIRTPLSRVGNDCYIGLWSWLGWVDIGDDFMSGSHIVILSGRHQHGFHRTDVAMRLQHGAHRCVKIGEDVWVGASVTIAEDVASHSVVASGSVVTKTFEPYDILGGVPAEPIGSRLKEHEVS